MHPSAFRLYQVWDCSAEVMVPGPRFRSPGDALAFAQVQDNEYAIQRPDGTWLKPPPAPPPDENDDERRRSRRIRVFVPGRLELTPGRVNASQREILATLILDAAEAGLRLRVNGDMDRLHRHDLVRVLFNSVDTTVQLPARVVWLDNGSIGVQFKLVDRQQQTDYSNWLGVIRGPAVDNSNG